MNLCNNTASINIQALDSRVSEQLIFEQPLNERIRTFLRLDHLFKQFQQHLEHNSAWDTHSAIKAILEILALVSRGDIKRETIKELERQNSNLQAFIEIPDINHGKLSLLIDDQKKCIMELLNSTGNIGQELHQNELLNAIKQRLTMPGGLCDFDLPIYAYWLKQPYENRKQILMQWFKPFETMQTAINLILQVIRDSTEYIDEVAENGFFQKNLETTQTCLLIRVMVDINAHIFPEISAGRQRFSIRFLKTQNPAQRPEQEGSDVPFRLACCFL